jgi:hypothetical protein
MIHSTLIEECSMKPHATPRIVPLFALVCLAFTGCYSTRDLAPGMGSAVAIQGRSYQDVWDATMRATGDELDIEESDREAGVIRAATGDGFFNPRTVVGAFITPARKDAGAYTVEIVSRIQSRMALFGKNWEPVLIENVRKRLAAGSTGNIRRWAWQLVTTTDSFPKVFIESLDDRSLLTVVDGMSYAIPVDSIVRLCQRRPNGFWTGAGIGYLAGGLAGLVVGLSNLTSTRNCNWPLCAGNAGYNTESEKSSNYGEMLLFTAGGFAGGFLVGGVIGSGFGGDVVYDLHGMNTGEKFAVIHSIIEDKWKP